MPEGPSIVILREQAAPLAGQAVQRLGGSAAADHQRLLRRKLLGVHSWGKHFLLQFPECTLRVHFGLFGSHAIGKPKDARKPRLSLYFKHGELHLYACTLRLLEGAPEAHYDWSSDLLSEHWNAAAARDKLRQHPQLLACDALLDQEIFAGAGNIIKNEVLFRIRVHPESTVGALPARKLSELVKEVQKYSVEFLDWKKAGELKQHWLAHTRKTCPRCDLPLHCAVLGRTQRRSFFCSRCQALYRQPLRAEPAISPRAQAAAPPRADEADRPVRPAKAIKAPGGRSRPRRAAAAAPNR